MTDDSALDGFDPFDALDREAVRLDAFFSTLPATEWVRHSRCPGWSTRDLLAHLAASEAYHHACLDGRVRELLTNLAARGATDLDSANRIGIEQLADYTPKELLSMWRAANLETRQGFRQRGDGMIDTSVGEYPCRWQAFHVASELATHADDVFVPVADDEDQLRWAWRVAFSRFALVEAKPDVVVEPVGGGRWRVRSENLKVTVGEHDLMEGVTGRLDESSGLSPAELQLLKA
ncbi:MAG: maleylpyruvate isomerase family mycothiol-dependent enzyme [Acidimicrobiales bacterium]